MSHISIKNLPESERPYERFLNLGAEALSDAELLAIILKTGTKDQTVLDLARELLSQCQGNLLNLYDLSFEELMSVQGIGRVKATQLKAVAELSRRIARTGRGYNLLMDKPSTIADYYMEELRHERQEVFMGAFFDAKHAFLGDCKITKGTNNTALIAPGELFRQAVLCNAVSIVVLHNHPSGDPTPSEQDTEITSQLFDAAKLIGLNLTDHIVIGDNRYYSFSENHVIIGYNTKGRTK
jgi:DNA repair protein RadC